MAWLMLVASGLTSLGGYITEGWEGCQLHGHYGLICDADDGIPHTTGSGLFVEHDVLFYAKLSTMGAPDYAAVGITSPTFEWWGDDPDGALGYTSVTFAASGSPATEDGPFGRDVIETAGSDYYTYTGTDAGSWTDSTWLFVARAESPSTTQGVLRLVDASEGNVMSLFIGTSTCSAYLQDAGSAHAGSTTAATTFAGGAWVMCAVVIDISGAATATAYINGKNADASPLDISSFDALAFSADDTTMVIPGVASATRLTGAIAYAAIIPEALSAADISALWYEWGGLWDAQRVHAPTCTNTGPIYTWDGGELEGFTDDWCMLNGDQPPGATGAGAKTGYHSLPGVQNQILQSRDLSTSWTETGTAVVSCGEADTPFRDGRTTCLVTDDDGAGAEYISQVHAWSAAVTGSVLQLCVTAHADGASSADVQVVEATGCAGSTVNYAAQSVTTTWTELCWSHTVADGACTDFTVRISPTTDITDASATGAARFTAVTLARFASGTTAWIPTWHCPTTTAAVTCGSPILKYTTPLEPNRVRVTEDIVFAQTGTGLTWYFFAFNDTSATTVDWQAYIAGGNKAMRLDQQTTGTFADSGALSWTAGTSYSVDFRTDLARDIHQIRRDGTVLVNSTTAANVTTSTDEFYVCNGYAASGSPDAWCSNVKVRR